MKHWRSSNACSVSGLLIFSFCGFGNTHQKRRACMANSFGTDILIQAPDPVKAAAFYVEHLKFEITADTPQMVSLHGKHINLFIERGPVLGPVLEVTVEDVQKAQEQLVAHGS